MAIKLILARHGRTSWNVAGRIQGHRGDSLDEAGREQAIVLACDLLSIDQHPICIKHSDSRKIDRVYTSDLPRAHETGQIVAQKLGLELRLEKRLRECSFGLLEGLTHVEVEAKFSSNFMPHLNDRSFQYDFRQFNGESRAQVVQRQIEFLQEFDYEGYLGTALLIGHGRSFNNLLSHLWPGIDPIEDNCAYRVVYY